MGSVKVRNEKLKARILELFPDAEIRDGRVYGKTWKEANRMLQRALFTFPFVVVTRPCGCCDKAVFLF